MKKVLHSKSTGPTSMVLIATSWLPHPSCLPDPCGHNVVTTCSFTPPHLVDVICRKRLNNMFPLSPSPGQILFTIYLVTKLARGLFTLISRSHTLILLVLDSDFFLFLYICAWYVCEAFPGFNWGFWKEWCLVCYREFWMTASLLHSQECWAQHSQIISTCYIGIRYHNQDPFSLLSLRYYLQDRQSLQEESDQPWGRYSIQSQVPASPKPSWFRLVGQYK